MCQTIQEFKETVALVVNSKNNGLSKNGFQACMHSMLVWSLPLRIERKGLEQCIYQTRSAVQKY